ncbi:DUF1795 domain-containing protein [Burkholderia ambifaria]|uniref:DcrB-related protein n=1 Tax=Burkholderia ambifaria TaxID=152480 RepID=UPI001E3C1251|nr:DcrB-related protein [Burkholderia ambifaria]UEP37248.1 DUF1795 domain-containing protein [Burkholderia ambifaria]
MKLIKLAKSLTGRTFHQMQTAFRLDASGQVIVMTLTNAAPLNDEQRALVVRMLESFQPRPVALPEELTDAECGASSRI